MKGTRNPAATSQRILETASQLFYAHGIRAVGVDRIAAEARVTKRTMYKHFASKDALVAAYLDAQDGPILSRLIETTTNAPGDVAARVAALFESLGSRATAAGWHGCPFARAVSEMRTAATDAVATRAVGHKSRFEAWLEAFLRDGGVADAGDVARQIMVLLDGCIIQLLIHRDPAYAAAAAAAARTLVNERLG